MVFGFGGGKITKKLIFVVLIIFSIATFCSNNLYATNETQIENGTNLTQEQSELNNSVSTNSTEQSTSITSNSTENKTAAAGEANYSNVHGVWIPSDSALTLSAANVTQLVNSGITDVYIKSNIYSGNLYSTVLTYVVNLFKNSGIRVNAWVTCFMDSNGNWIDPKNSTHNSEIIAAIYDMAKNYGISGVNLDYVRYPGTAYKYSGGADAITSFVANVYNTVKGVSPNLAVSADLMPEGSVNAYYYGQNYSALSQYLDYLVPMIYKGNYNKDTAWIGTTTAYIVSHSNGKPVIVGLQTYESDSNVTALSSSELKADVNAAMSNGASGYALFRYGLISGYPDTNNSIYTLQEIEYAANEVRKFMESTHILPEYITLSPSKPVVPVHQFLQMLITSTLQAYSGTITPQLPVNISAPTISTGNVVYGNINQTEYLAIAQAIQNYINTNNAIPNNSTSSIGIIQYKTLVYTYSKIIDSYRTNNKLPSSILIDSTVANPAYTIQEIQYAANEVKKFMESTHTLPGYITLSPSKPMIPVHQFLQILITSTLQINSGTITAIMKDTLNINAPASSTGNDINGNLNQTEYLAMTQTIQTYMNTNKTAPSNMASSLGTIDYATLIYTYSKIITYYGTNNKLPNTVLVDSTVANLPLYLLQYLQATNNCQVNDASIQSLAASITSGKSSTYEKAEAIFNWVRDNIGYSFYYNTQKGALGALSARTANCCDTTHLLVALERAAGIPARYEHLYAQFTSGSWYGHVIAQVWVNGAWYNADGTSYRNTFGNIYNWNTITATYRGTYATLPF